MRYLLIVVLGTLIFFDGKSQGCCSGGSGSPIAGGYSQGVLRGKQVELAANYRYTYSDKFFKPGESISYKLTAEAPDGSIVAETNIIKH